MKIVACFFPYRQLTTHNMTISPCACLTIPHVQTIYNSPLTIHHSPLTIMFQRQAREPFPVRNILLLAAFILGCLFYVLKNMKEEPAPKPDQELGMRDEE